MSISDGLGPSILRRNMEETRLIQEEMDRKVLFSHLSGHFYLHASQTSTFTDFLARLAVLISVFPANEEVQVGEKKLNTTEIDLMLAISWCLLS